MPLEAYHTLIDPARRRQHDIVLGDPTYSRRVIAEPLFDPARSSIHRMPLASTKFDELMTNLLSRNLIGIFEYGLKLRAVWSVHGRMLRSTSATQKTTGPGLQPALGGVTHLWF